MKISGKPMDIDYDIADVQRAVQEAMIQDKARITKVIVHDLAHRGDWGTIANFFRYIGPTDTILLRDMVNEAWSNLYGEKQERYTPSQSVSSEKDSSGHGDGRTELAQEQNSGLRSDSGSEA